MSYSRETLFHGVLAYYNILINSQFSFRKSKATKDAIASIIDNGNYKSYE
jgi:hypothetical protein